ncbi:hypothetical protein [Amycolatopsis sp. NPDC051903]|uniref:hypothetical protein n=1 Tax=Amycolatopsis sp. NPDC051903 TaxID=3363936 RepID=UPI0037B36272
MPLLTQPPMVPLATCTLRTHELRIGSEVVERDGSTTYVQDHGADDTHIRLQLTNGVDRTFRRHRRWRVIASPAEVSAPFLSAV